MVRAAVEESWLLIPLVIINTDKIILPEHSESIILNLTLLNFSLTYFHCESPARRFPASFFVCEVLGAAVEIVSLGFRGPPSPRCNIDRESLLVGLDDLFSRSHYRKQKGDGVEGLTTQFPSQLL